MNVREKTWHLASQWEQCASIMRNCHAPDEIRTGFRKCSEILSSNSSADKLVQRLRDWSRQQGSSLADFELESVRDNMIREFAKASAFMQDTARGLPPLRPEKKWWRFWRKDTTRASPTIVENQRPSKEEPPRRKKDVVRCSKCGEVVELGNVVCPKCGCGRFI